MLKIIFFISLMTFTTFSYATIYKIKKGNHNSGIHAALVSTKKFNFTAKFDDSGKYSLSNINQFDINKLYGFSDCFSNQHKNSARFGWVWNEKASKMEIHAYTYAKGVRNYKYITSVPINKSHSFSIAVDGKNYIMTANGVTVRMERGCSSKIAFGYKLYPYFGGDEVAPHDITIEIN